MSIVRVADEADVEGDVAAIYAEDIADQGYVAGHTKVMAINPEAERAWEALIRTIALPLGKRRYELVTLAAARGLASRHCLLAHGARSLQLFDEPELISIAADYRDAGLSAADVAMMAYAEKVSVAAHTMTDADSQSLRDAGFTDREIVDITLAAAARNYYSRAVQALAVEVDVPPALSPALAAALVAPLEE